MPFDYRCTQHPDWEGTHLSEAVEHAEIVPHANAPYDYMVLRDVGIITCKVIRQNEAQGNANLHTFMCGCGTYVTKREGHPCITARKCETCMGKDVLEAHGG